MSFVQREAQTLSRQIEIARSFVDDLENVLVGQSAASPVVCDALQAIAAHRMPLRDILDASASCQDLRGWIRELRQRSMKLPSGDEDSCTFDMSVFNRPESFLDAAVRHLARQQFKSLHCVCLTATHGVCITLCCCFYLCAILIQIVFILLF